jgi:glycosyltransferase involved in cell wall biosynthesis
MQNLKIFYLCPDHNKPSWGIGIIYHHISILVEAGYDAYVLHENKNFKVDWLDLKVPIISLESFAPSDGDVLVVPEFMAADPKIKQIHCRKIFFVQGLSLLFNGFDASISHLSLGYKEAIIIMPHMEKVVREYTQIKPRLIPPLIAEYFYKNPIKLNEREKIILFFPKQHQFEYSLLKQLIVSKAGIKTNSFLNRLDKNNWRVIELRDQSHQEVADLMSRATFLLTTNTFEAFNTAVPEAMASGCINICYEAVGPADYLENRRNAFVFQNNRAIEMAEHTIDLIVNFEQYENELRNIRLNAYNTALNYSREKIKIELLDYFSSIDN